MGTSPPPPEEAVLTLVAMGFDRDDALQALAIAGNDMTTATNLLLESQMHWGSDPWVLHYCDSINMEIGTVELGSP